MITMLTGNTSVFFNETHQDATQRCQISVRILGERIPRNSLVTSRLGSDSSAMSNSPAFFLPFCLLELFSSTNADVGSMIDKAVSSSQDKTQENISRLWTLHESHF